MIKLNNVPGITKPVRDLLAAVGIEQAEQLEQADVGGLTKEVERLCQEQAVSKRKYGEKDVRRWVQYAQLYMDELRANAEESDASGKQEEQEQLAKPNRTRKKIASKQGAKKQVAKKKRVGQKVEEGSVWEGVVDADRAEVSEVLEVSEQGDEVGGADSDGGLNLENQEVAKSESEAGVEKDAEIGGDVAWVDYEQLPEVQALLGRAPLAIPLPAISLVQQGVGVSEIPVGWFLNQYPGDLDVRVEKRLPDSKKHQELLGKRAKKEDPRKADVEREDSRKSWISNPVQVLGMDFRAGGEDEVTKVGGGDGRKHRMRPTGGGAMIGSVSALPTMITANEDERLKLIRSPREETNKGKDPNSRWYIRGVLHPQPSSVYLATFVTLFLLLSFIASIVATVLLVSTREGWVHYEWVGDWVAWVLVSLPLAGMAYWMFAANCRCRICGQKLFMHQRHLKNRKAHYSRIFGFVLPLCFQLLIFRWFRCTHCGTPIRLKE